MTEQTRPEGHQVERIGRVHQRIEGEQWVWLHKEVHDLGGEIPLVMVRKHLPTGPTRPCVLLVHGFAQNRYSWHNSHRSISAWLAAQGWDTWNLELRGHGRSRQDRRMGAEGFADYVDDVARAVRSLPGPSFLVGHSLGGAALFGATTQLVGSRHAPLGVIGLGALYKFGRANPVFGTLGRITHAARDLPWVSQLGLRTRLFGTVMARLMRVSDVAGYAVPVSGWWPGSVEPEVLEERLTQGFDGTSARVWQEMSRWAATGEFEYHAAWKQTDVPLLVCLGDRDHLMPIRDGRAAYEASGSADKTLHVFDDWHHRVHWGHLDLVMGRWALSEVWPLVHGWMADRSRSQTPTVQ